MKLVCVKAASWHRSAASDGGTSLMTTETVPLRGRRPAIVAAGASEAKTTVVSTFSFRVGPVTRPGQCLRR